MHHRSPIVVAIAGVAGVLIAFSIVVVAGQTRIKVPPSLFFFLLLCPTKSPPLRLLFWCLTGGERKVANPLLSSVYYGILSVVCCARMDARRPCCRSFVAGATSVLVTFFIMVAAGFLAPFSSSFCSAQSNLLYVVGLLHFLLLPPSSFLLPLFFLLLLLGFYLNQLILVFIFVRVTVDLLARAADLLMFIKLVNW